MLWNWYTIDSCFLARSWHVRSRGAFAASCIGVILLVLALEFLRRLQREYDRHLHRTSTARLAPGGGVPHDSESSEHSSTSNDGVAVGAAPSKTPATFRVRLWDRRGAVNHPNKARLHLGQHALRSLLYMLQFAVGYFVMLLAMYYNGEFFHLFLAKPPSPLLFPPPRLTFFFSHSENFQNQ